MQPLTAGAAVDIPLHPARNFWTWTLELKGAWARATPCLGKYRKCGHHSDTILGIPWEQTPYIYGIRRGTLIWFDQAFACHLGSRHVCEDCGAGSSTKHHI